MDSTSLSNFPKIKDTVDLIEIGNELDEFEGIENPLAQEQLIEIIDSNLRHHDR